MLTFVWFLKRASPIYFAEEEPLLHHQVCCLSKGREGWMDWVMGSGNILIGTHSVVM